MNELIKIENGTPILDTEASHKIAYFEQQLKDIKAKEDELKKAIMKSMEEHGIVKIETDELIINYIATTDRERFDVKAFQRENPNRYDDYVKITKVKPSIRLKVK